VVVEAVFLLVLVENFVDEELFFLFHCLEDKGGSLFVEKDKV